MQLAILHGSQTGTATDYAQRLFNTARRHHHDPLLRSLDDITLFDLVEVDVVCFIVSTTGQGEIPQSMRTFWDSLLIDMNDALEGLQFCILGLGDTKYEEFNWTAKKLRRRLLQLGAVELIDIGLCDESASEGLDTVANVWRKTFENIIWNDPLPRDVLLPPIHPLRPGRYNSVDDRLCATVTLNERITPLSHFQDVRRLCFSKIDVNPGDVLCLFPVNSDADVESFLHLMNWEDIELQVDVPGLPSPLTLFSLAKHVFPLNDVPSITLFNLLGHFSSPDLREKFDEWESDPQDFYDYVTRPRRTLLEVLDDFSNGIKVPIEYALDLFGKMQPREYSISMLGEHIELIVAMVHYQTRIKVPRRGVASRYIDRLAVGDQVHIRIRRNPIHIPDAPIFCIGPGTGFAPLRFLLSRHRQRQTLLFGCRSDDDDYARMFRPTKYIAYSRKDGKYVQALVPTTDILDYVDTGYFYLSGSAGDMPKSVRRAIDNHCGVGTVARLEHEGRWWQETWS